LIWLNYAETAGGARLREKENDGAEYEVRSKPWSGVSRAQVKRGDTTIGTSAVALSCHAQAAQLS
jgi:hypothetical protein